MIFYIVLIILILLMIGISGFLIYERQKTIKEISSGALDAQIIYEDHLEDLKKEKKKRFNSLRKILNIGLDVLIGVLAIFFIFGLIDRTLNISPLPYKSVVVATGSMSFKNEENDYLFENNLDNQIQVDDLIFLTKVNSLEDIKLYDIVCYKNEEGYQIVHRVIEIADDYVITRGDANNASDGKIYFSQIVGVYSGVRIPRVGSITFFLTSDYGISTIATILVISIVYSFVKNSIEKNQNKRLEYLQKEIASSKEYILNSSNGKLTVNGDNYDFTEFEEDKKEEINSTLTIDNETKILQKGNLK